MIAVGAPGSDELQGMVYLFRPGDNGNGGTTWLSLDELKDNMAPAAQVGNFGWSVALHKTILLVGAPFNEDLGKGKLFIYKGETNVWGLYDTIAPGIDDSNDQFGFSVALDDSIAVVGAREADNGVGAAYIYEIPEGDPPNPYTQDRVAPLNSSTDAIFGHSVALKNGIMVVGSPTRTESGSFYLYYLKENEPFKWERSERVLDGSDNDNQYAKSVAISENNLVVGAPENEIRNAGPGSMFAFELVKEKDNEVTQVPVEISPMEKPSSSSSIPGEIPLNLVSMSIPGKRYVSSL